MTQISFSILEQLKEAGKPVKGWFIDEDGCVQNEETDEGFVSIRAAEIHLSQKLQYDSANQEFRELFVDPTVELLRNFHEAGDALLKTLPATRDDVPENKRFQVHIKHEETDQLSWFDFMNIHGDVFDATARAYSLLDRVETYIEAQKGKSG